MTSRIGHDDIPPERQPRTIEDAPGQLGLFDLDEGRRRRDEGTAHAAENAEDWRETYRAAFDAVRQRGEPFTADDVRRELDQQDAPPPHHHNALGAMFRALARAAGLEPVGFRESATASRHAGAVRVWAMPE